MRVSDTSLASSKAPRKASPPPEPSPIQGGGLQSPSAPLARRRVRFPRRSVLQHRLDVGGEGRKAVNQVADLSRGDTVLDRQREDVDQLFGDVPEKMCAEDTVGTLVDHHLRPGGILRIGATRQPLAQIIDG